MILTPGDRAPAFDLLDDRGERVRLSALKGQRVVLYAYPAAMTPGCTTQACDFRDNLAAFTADGLTILGISPDTPDRLAAFRERDDLPFRLLSDPDRTVLEAYGAYGEKKLYGKVVTGVIRSTFVISPTGRIEHAFYNVKATGHVAKLMRDLGVGGGMRTIDRTVVDEDTIAQYRADGCVVVRGLFSPDEVETVRAGIERNLAEPGPLFGVASRDDDPGRFVEDFCNWQRIDEYRQIAFESKAADAAGALMGGSVVRLYHDHMLVKEPGTRQPTPWHQDQPYYNVEGFDTISMWMPVDPVAPESTLEFLAGSHRGGWLMPRTFLTEQAQWFPEGSLAELPDIESDRDAYDIRGWALEPGDVVFFHMLTAHHAYGVPGANRRRAFSLRFLGDDATHAPRPWRTSPEFAGLADELPAGAPMDHPLFPVLRTA